MHLVSAKVLEQWNTLSDEQVVAQVLGGHTALFELLMRRYNERVYRVARAMVRDEDEAEDVMQQAYVNAYANLRQFNGRSLFSTWLTRIAINEALGRLRRKRRYEPWTTNPRRLSTPSCRLHPALRSNRRWPGNYGRFSNGRLTTCPMVPGKCSSFARWRG